MKKTVVDPHVELNRLVLYGWTIPITNAELVTIITLGAVRSTVTLGTTILVSTAQMEPQLCGVNNMLYDRYPILWGYQRG
ncbi:MAG: hypothetical protein ACXV3D_04635 [Halobacteriota archaeon]